MSLDMKFKIFDKYIRVARVYPAVLGLFPICTLLAMCIEDWFPCYEALFGNAKNVFWLIGGTSLINLALGYLVSELFRETSKWLFQYQLFKKDETEMPTTKLLLWQTSAISSDYHNAIAIKVNEIFGMKLPTREEEKVDLESAKKVIVDVVSQIRQLCRGDKILRQYNIEFGFCRNYLGASVWSICLIVILLCFNVFLNMLSWWIILLFLIIQIMAMMGFYLLLETRGWAYARYLFATFMAKTK